MLVLGRFWLHKERTPDDDSAPCGVVVLRVETQSWFYIVFVEVIGIMLGMCSI